MRVSFPKGKQTKFINKIIAKISIKEAARLCDLSERTIRDWRREKFLVDIKALRKLCHRVHISFPSGVKIRDRYWYVAQGASMGAIAVLKKYGYIGGDPEYRKKKWREWWKQKGKNRGIFINTPKPIRKPHFSKELAEFVGIVLGDGGITQRQVVITLHSEDDREYGKFISSLVKRLFNTPVSIHYDKKYLAADFVISRSELVRFCVERLGLKKGNKVKQQVDVPEWIKKNQNYAIACVRGLIDTDGSVFNHRYKVNGKIYSYKKLSFTNFSEPLRQSVFNILRNIGLNPRLAQRKDVRIDSIHDMRKYFQLIGSHNPKYWKKYRE